MAAIKRLPTAALLVAAVVLCGCVGISIGDDVPARIIDADAGSNAALQKAVDRALGTHVLLSVDALTESSVLNVTIRPTGGIGKQPTEGRTMQSPFQFRLVRNNGFCILIDQRNDERHILEDTLCRTE